MKAVTFTSPGRLRIEGVPDPQCSADEVIVRVDQAGICGTDVHIYRDEYLSTFPLIAGHEFVGRVAEVGTKDGWLQPGDRVAVDPNLYCGECYFCRQEQANHCLNWQGVGITRPGAFAEFVAVPRRACYKVPEHVNDTQAAFIEPLSCVIHALKRIRVWPGDDVLIFGAGPMGLLLVQALQHSGASTVTVVEKEANRCELALSMGAANALPAGEDTDGQLRAIAPHGHALVIDATGAPSVIEQALCYVRPRGQYLQFGVAPRGATVQWQPYDIFHRDLTIIGSFALCYTFQPAIAWLTSGRVTIEPLVSHVLPLAGFPEGFEEFMGGKTLKVHIRPGG